MHAIKLNAWNEYERIRLGYQRSMADWSGVKARIDLEAVATHLLGPHWKRKGQRLFWPCPFHDDHHPSFDVSLDKGLWYCRVCGIGGDAAELVKRINRCDFPAAVRFLAGLAGVLPSSPGGSPRPVIGKPAARPPADVIQHSGSRPFGSVIGKPAARPPAGPSGLPLEEGDVPPRRSVPATLGARWQARSSLPARSGPDR